MNMTAKHFFKSLGITIGIYLGLNLLFIILYVVAGGFVVNNAPVRFIEFWTVYFVDDIGGFFMLLITPGGGAGILGGDLFSGLMYYVYQLLAVPSPHYAWKIVGILWVFVPGMVTSLIIGFKFSNEMPRSSFWSVLVAIFFLTVFPIIGQFVGAIPAWHSLTAELIHPVYWTHLADATRLMINPITIINIGLMGFLNGAFFGSIAAISSSNL